MTGTNTHQLKSGTFFVDHQSLSVRNELNRLGGPNKSASQLDRKGSFLRQ